MRVDSIKPDQPNKSIHNLVNPVKIQFIKPLNIFKYVQYACILNLILIIITF